MIELFSLGVRAEALWAHINWKSPFLKRWGQFGPKFSSRKTRWIDLSYGIRMSADLSFVLLQFTRLTDRHADGQTALRSLRPRCIQCSGVMSVHWRHTWRSDEEKDQWAKLLIISVLAAEILRWLQECRLHRCSLLWCDADTATRRRQLCATKKIEKKSRPLHGPISRTGLMLQHQ